ncbi:MAG: M48 family metallopeptidase [Sporolactobacillus sp.]
MKKVTIIFAISYTLYLLLIGLYFFVWAHHGVPASVKGTAADPTYFMSARQLAASAQINPWRHFISFASIPLEWAVYFFLLFSGLSVWLRRSAERLSHSFIVQMLFCFLVVTLLTTIVFWPIDFISYQLSQAYGLSVQPFAEWFKDQAVSLGVDSLIGFLSLTVVFFFIRRSPKNWWFPVWLLSVPFIIFLMYLQPVVIDPLYNHFQPLRSGALKQEILSMANRAGIPADNVYQVDMSTQTHTMNAYVNGIGSNLRIVLWDTTLQQLTNQQILFIMAHEMGHYVMHHILWGTAAALAALLVGLFLTAKLLLWSSQKWATRLNLQHPGDLAALPLVLLLFAMLSFAGEPAQNAVSRHFEWQADNYAIQLTHNRQAGIAAFQRLAASSLSEANPPALVRWIQYDHPPISQRIEFLEKVKLSHQP